jgi:hypothetical protein
MDDTLAAERPVPRWYMAAAIASLLFMLVGVWGFFMDVTTDPHSLSPGQQALSLARPTWMKVAYGAAVWMGAAGAVLLLRRSRLAEPVLLVSLAATVLTFLPYAIVPEVRSAVSTSDVIAGVIVILVVALICGFARRARQRGWLQ